MLACGVQMHGQVQHPAVPLVRVISQAQRVVGEHDGILAGPTRCRTRGRIGRCGGELLVRAIGRGRRIVDNLKRAMAYILAIHVPIAGMALVPVLLGTVKAEYKRELQGS